MVNVTERKAVDTDSSPGRTYCFDLRGVSVNAFLEAAVVRSIGVGAVGRQRKLRAHRDAMQILIDGAGAVFVQEALAASLSTCEA